MRRGKGVGCGDKGRSAAFFTGVVGVGGFEVWIWGWGNLGR